MVRAKGIKGIISHQGFTNGERKTLSFGTVTPWGDVELASSTFTDRRWVNKKEIRKRLIYYKPFHTTLLKTI
ncbi:hypothetical protein PO124_29480 [Bacillus licheniformis]|nr:hypothetical protein [Bacillus licheniformis]